MAYLNGHACLWDAGGVTDLSTIGNQVSVARAINDNGEVAGTIGHPRSNQAFRWREGTIQGLGTLGSYGSSATAINNVGQVAGSSPVDGQRPRTAPARSRGTRALSEAWPTAPIANTSPAAAKTGS